jgi:UDP-glucose 4-epimerase
MDSTTTATGSLQSADVVLVTGATGFIGTPLCARLCSLGIQTHAVSRLPADSHSPSGLHWWQCDLTDAALTRDVVMAIKPTVIFHLASLPTGARSLELVLPIFNDGLRSTVHLLTAAAQAGVHRFIYSGSLEEPRTAQAVPSSPYAAAKWGSSAYVRMFYRLYQLPTVIARLFMVYGPGQSQSKLIPSVIQALRRGHSPEVASGRRRVDWIYVDDVVEGLLRTATVPHVEGKTMDLGSGTLITIREVVESIVALMGSSLQPRFGARPDPPFEVETQANLTRSRDLLDWQPAISLTEGLSKTIQSFS